MGAFGHPITARLLALLRGAEMNVVLQALLARLCRKGLSPEEVPWLIRDFLNALGGRESHSARSVSCRLARLGWPDEVMDPVTFELMVCFLEDEDRLPERPSTIH